jgi:hypothetical protein
MAWGAGVKQAALSALSVGEQVAITLGIFPLNLGG